MIMFDKKAIPKHAKEMQSQKKIPEKNILLSKKNSPYLLNDLRIYIYIIYYNDFKEFPITISIFAEFFIFTLLSM